MSAEVKPGYKLTEVGVIPEDWEVFLLSETAKRITDGEHLTPIRLLSGYYLLSARNILNGRIDLSDVDYVGKDEYRRIRQRCNPETGDVLISCSGTIGRVATVPNGLECVLVRSAALIKPNPEKINGTFVQYFLQSTAGQKQIFVRINQGAQANLFLNHIKELRVPLPNKVSEQEAIAEALSDADALIESLQQLIAKKRQIKQGAMQDLLTGKKRLPGFSGEWELKRLGDVVKVTKGQLITEQNAISGHIPVIAGGKKPAYFHNKPNRTGKTITVSASGASAGYVAFFDEPIFASDCSTISEGDGYSIEFIYSQLQLKQDIIYKAQTGGAQPHIHAVDLMPIEIGVPTFSEQQAIAIIFSDMDAEIDSLAVKLEKARQLKQGIMNNLLTGKIRLV